MTITIDSVSDKVRQILRDEVDVQGVTDFTTDQIKGAIYEALVDISVASPLVKNVPILTNAGTRGGIRTHTSCSFLEEVTLFAVLNGRSLTMIPPPGYTNSPSL